VYKTFLSRQRQSPKDSSISVPTLNAKFNLKWHVVNNITETNAH